MKSMWDIAKECMEPLVYVDELEREILITADLPAVSEEDLEINATEDSLEISARVKKPFEYKSFGSTKRSVCFRAFRKELSLGSKIDPDKAQMRFKKGVLRLTFPKNEID